MNNAQGMIFVTGATGFLGSHLVYRLMQSGRAVRALIRNRSKIDGVRRIWQTYPNPRMELLDQVEWVEGDLLDYPRLLALLKNVSQVYHAAGWVGFDRADRRHMMEVNVTGTANLINACLQNGNPRICHVSSIAALGDADDGSEVDETRLWVQGSASSAYALSKFLGEMEAWRGFYEGLPVVIVNPSVITGPGMWEGTAGGLLRQVEKGLPYVPPGSSGYVDVRDVVQVMVDLMETPVSGERFIVSAENRAHREVIGYISERLGKRMPSGILTPFIIRAGSTAERIRAFVLHRKPRFSKESLSVSLSVSTYSNQKIREALSCSFIPVRQSIQDSLRHFPEASL
jgi:dihydroflavonol-4-reductase